MKIKIEMDESDQRLIDFAAKKGREWLRREIPSLCVSANGKDLVFGVSLEDENFEHPEIFKGWRLRRLIDIWAPGMDFEETVQAANALRAAAKRCDAWGRRRKAIDAERADP